MKSLSEYTGRIKLITTAFVCAFFLVVAGFIGCYDKSKQAELSSERVIRDTIYTIADTVYIPGKTVKITVPKLVKGDTQYVVVPKEDGRNYDSLYRLYKGTYVYTDSWQQDSSKFLIEDTISSNRIVGRKYDFDIPTKVITKESVVMIKEPKKRGLYVGIGAGYDLSKPTLNTGIIYKTKKDLLINPQVGIGFNSSSPTYQLNFYTPLIK